MNEIDKQNSYTNFQQELNNKINFNYDFKFYSFLTYRCAELKKT